MAKHPAPGEVKTRLAPALGPERACALYAAFVQDLAARLQALPYEVTWAYWPPESPFPALLPGARCRPQRGADLGERMAGAIADAFSEGPTPVMVIGADAPHLPADSIAEAATMLGGEADLVLGPAADGGYYLVGLCRPQPELFTGIPWSTAGVLAATGERAAALGLRQHLLAPCFDVDGPGDLALLGAILARGEVHLPRTARLLATPGRTFPT